MDDYKTVNAILDNREGYLRRNLVLSTTVINKLRDNGIISDGTRLRMLGEPSLVQIEILLEILRRSDIFTFRKFLRVLKETHNSWVADAILDSPYIDTVVRDRLRFGWYDDYDLYYRDKLATDVTLSRIAPRSASLIPERARLGLYRDDLSPTLYGHTSPALYERTSPALYGRTVPPPLVSGPSVLYNNYTSNADKAMVALRQEEMAIKDLLGKNAREQLYVYQNQRELREVDSRLHDLHRQAKALEYRPAPICHNAQDRLSALYRLT